MGSFDEVFMMYSLMFKSLDINVDILEIEVGDDR